MGGGQKGSNFHSIMCQLQPLLQYPTCGKSVTEKEDPKSPCSRISSSDKSIMNKCDWCSMFSSYGTAKERATHSVDTLDGLKRKFSAMS